MLLGIGGCTALVLTALGLNDTIQNVVTRQYDDIILYDYEITMAYDMNEEEQEIFFRDAGDDIKDAVFLYRGLAEVSGGDAIKSATLTVTDGKRLYKYIDLSFDGEPIDYPGRGEAAINYNLARQLGGIEVGDEIKLTTSEKKELTVTVSALFDNYVDSFVFISPETCEEQLGAVPEYKSALANAPDGTDVNRCAEALTHDVDGVRGVTLSTDIKERMSSMLDGLLVVVAAIILCAGLLAFIVLYNLTNINISERIREIATLKVLGFYPNEAAHYVFRENLILTGAGAVFGLGLGVALHAFVMNAIKVDMMYFKPHISFLSFAVSIVITFVFAMIVNAIMRRRIDNIDMAGALKSIE